MMGFNVQERTRALEVKIVTKLVEDAIAKGYEVALEIEESEKLDYTPDAKSILPDLYQCDEDYLHFRKGEEHGWVRLVYGNGWYVICDYSATNSCDKPDSLWQFFSSIVEYAIGLEED